MAKLALANRADAGWIDEVAVERSLAGVPVGRALTFGERQEVARRLHQQFVEVTARRLRVKPEDVHAALDPQYRQRDRAERRARRVMPPCPRAGEQLRVA